jgi:nitrogen fixation NifU-like protein
LPADHVHCAELSVGALYLALSNYQELNRASWKKLYQGKF